MVDKRLLEVAIWENPGLLDFQVVVLTRHEGKFAERGIGGLEFDEKDEDINVVLTDTVAPVSVATFLKNIGQLTQSDQYPIYTRKYLQPPLTIDDEPFTHLDSPLYCFAIQNDARKLRLFESFAGVEEYFK